MKKTLSLEAAKILVARAVQKAIELNVGAVIAENTVTAERRAMMAVFGVTTMVPLFTKNNIQA